MRPTSYLLLTLRFGLGGGTRTHTDYPTDFESVMSANSITPSQRIYCIMFSTFCQVKYLLILGGGRAQFILLFPFFILLLINYIKFLVKSQVNYLLIFRRRSNTSHFSRPLSS